MKRILENPQIVSIICFSVAGLLFVIESIIFMFRLSNVCATFLLLCGDGLFSPTFNFFENVLFILTGVNKPSKAYFFSCPAVLSDFWLFMDRNVQMKSLREPLVMQFLAQSDLFLHYFS